MTKTLDIPAPVGFRDGRPWLDSDPPAWEWPSFADYRQSVFDWRVEPDLTETVTVIDKVKAEGWWPTVRGWELRGRILGSHRETRPMFA